MSVRRIIGLSLLAAVFVGGCASDFPSRHGEPLESKAAFVSQDQARQLAFSYRRQAQDLRELAKRMEAEAFFSRGPFRVGIEQTHDRLQVKEVLAAAEDADKLAREYQRQVPHGQLQ